MLVHSSTGSLALSTMEEEIHNAKSELRRADHLVHVSLKYTRTVDVLKSVVQRLINTYDYTITALLKFKKVKDIPTIPRLKVDLVKKLFAKDEEIYNFMALYIFLRDVDRANFSRRLEFRRHVTMTAFLDDKEVEITIDIVEEYYKRTIEFVDYVEKLIK